MAEPKVYENLDEANAEVKRLTEVNEDVIGRRDKLKQTKTELETSVSTLTEQLNAAKAFETKATEVETKYNTLLGQVRGEKIKSSLKAKLTELGLPDDGFDTADALVDKSQIKFKDDGSVDEDSVKTIAEGIKTKHGILFAKPAPGVQLPGGGGGASNLGDEIDAYMKACEKEGKKPDRRKLDEIAGKYGKGK